MYNQERKYFKIVINSAKYAVHNTAMTQDTESAGFIDPFNPWDTKSFDAMGDATTATRAPQTGGIPVDNNWAKSKGRGTVRYLRLGQQLADQGGLCFYGNLALTYAGGIDTPNDGEVINYYPEAVELVVAYDQFSGMMVHNVEGIKINQSDAGEEDTDLFDGVKGIARLVQRVLTERSVRSCELFLPDVPAGATAEEYKNITHFDKLVVAAPADLTGSDTEAVKLANVVVDYPGSTVITPDVTITEIQIDDVFSESEYKLQHQI